MDESVKTQAPLALGKWIALGVAAVILAEGIWGILVSLTRSLLLPLLARVLGGDSHSPLYLGSGEINIADLFASILQLCVAGIVFLIIKSSVAKPQRAKTFRPKKIAQQPIMPSISTAPETRPIAAAAQAATASPSPALQVTTQLTSPTPAPEAAPVLSANRAEQPAKAEKHEKLKKPEKPREVYYNIVGEPINPTENE
jgi:large-conductance mechanosensitive channel